MNLRTWIKPAQCHGHKNCELFYSTRIWILSTTACILFHLCINIEPCHLLQNESLSLGADGDLALSLRQHSIIPVLLLSCWTKKNHCWLKSKQNSLPGRQ